MQRWLLIFSSQQEEKKKNTLWEYYFFVCTKQVISGVFTQAVRFFRSQSRWRSSLASPEGEWTPVSPPVVMITSSSKQQQQRYRDRLPSGDSALPKQISSSKNCWGPNPLITSTWNQIMVPESAARYNWCTWNKPCSSLLLLLLFLHHQFGTFISGYSLPGETGEKCQDKGDMAYPPSLAFSLPVLSLPPFFFLLLIHSPATLSLFSFYPVIYIVRSIFPLRASAVCKAEQARWEAEVLYSE